MPYVPAIDINEIRIELLINGINCRKISNLHVSKQFQERTGSLYAQEGVYVSLQKVVFPYQILLNP